MSEYHRTMLAKHAAGYAATTHVTPGAALIDRNVERPGFHAGIRHDMVQNHLDLIEVRGYPYGGDFIVVHSSGLVETWFRGDANPSSVQTVDEYRESVFCWLHDC